MTSRDRGIAWASNDVLRGRQDGAPIPVVAGRKFPTPSAGVNNQKLNQVVTVYSDPDTPEHNGIEYYRTDDYK
ncbi:hypothetical protein [Actinoplanes sp. ATCC 53533]|uniref:hypothetical protein n=1 Tax=Actinoplanes sp. ATCC 53533 TaxID=1288362 RepID=UPI000F777CB7|nr:hypothetical protein [Actinoplanes sp. ATCC 53533]